MKSTSTRALKRRKTAREIKQVIIVRKDLGMGVGKVAAQCSHASVMSYIRVEKDGKLKEIAETWLNEGATKIVLKVDNLAGFDALKEKLAKSGLPFSVIKDAGQTQIPPGTETAIGIGPYYTEEIDKITGGLKLL